MALRSDLDITKNLKMVEWLKAELIQSVGTLFKSLLKASAETTADALAGVMILVYLLGSRVGVSFSDLDREVKHKLSQSLGAAPQGDGWHQDMNTLSEHWRHKMR